MRNTLLRLARALGLFALARRRVRGALLILAYHGLAQADEDRWRPKLFMSRVTFQRRLALIRQWGVPIVSLGDGLDHLKRNSEQPYAITLTFDDGYSNFASLAAPELTAAGMRAMVYVCSYYAVHPDWPVFDLAIDYMFWSRPAGRVPGEIIGESQSLTASTPAERTASVDRVYSFAERNKLGGHDKDALARTLAGHLGFPYDDMVRERRLCLMPAEELQGVARRGFEVALHTHRHAIRESSVGLRQEVADNRAALMGLGVTPTEDFCYPSGEWALEMWPILEQAGIRSATTCEPGVARADTPRYALPRFLDSEIVEDIEFEAWVSGFMPWLYELTGRSRKRASSGGAA
ncbi:MAG TPA: polysaccharide deacetylase family protein [Methylomirabilota bacterium]